MASKLPTLFQKGFLLDPLHRTEVQKQLDNLVPVEYIVDWFKLRLQRTGIENRVLVLKSGTGSGKSSGGVVEIYRHIILPDAKSNKKTPGIIVTQPRVLTAIRNVYQILYNSSPDYPSFLTLGDNIGWSTKYNKLKIKRYGILSATVGTLVAQLKSMTDDEIMQQYRVIIIDETHERDLQIDMTIALLKGFLKRNSQNPRCPFVMLMSATFEPEKFLRFFGVEEETNFILVEGRAFTIHQHWDWNEGRTVNNYIKATATIVEKICRENTHDNWEQADILIFMPGKGEIKQVGDELYKVNLRLIDDKIAPMSILALDADAQRTENRSYMMLSEPTPNQVFIDKSGSKYICGRRCIIATNVAETGLTLENLKYVIDSGFNREVEFNPNYSTTALLTKPAAKSRIMQRMGRAGRKFDGHFYSMYPLWLFNMLPDIQLPEILLNDVSGIMLDIIYGQLLDKLSSASSLEFRIEDLDLLDIPSPDSLQNALERLFALGFVTFDAPILTNNVKMDMNAIIDADNQGWRKNGLGFINNRVDSNKIKFDGTDKNNPKFGLTKLGQTALLFNGIRPESIRMILAGFSWDCSIFDLITIATYLNITANEFPVSKKKGNYEGGEENIDEDIDLIIGGKSVKEKLIKTIDIAKEEPENIKMHHKRTKPKKSINWAEVYKHGAAGYLSGENELFKLRALIGDEFIDAIFLFNSLKWEISHAEPKFALQAIASWCSRCNINYDTMMRFVKAREDIIEQCLTAGFNCYKNESEALATTAQDQFMNCITKIKHCIYDGYRCNLVIRAADGKYKCANTGLEVSTPRLFANEEIKDHPYAEMLEKIKPRVLLYAELDIRYNITKNIYEVGCERLSVMDSFVNVDFSFLS